MNIQLTDEKLYQRLVNATIAKVYVGSNLYGHQTERSDVDYLYIYATSQEELNSLFRTNHQYQFKINGDDHLFVSAHTFVRNIINSDSALNFEVIYSGQLIGTSLQFLHDMRDDFITFNLIRMYLGFAKRDVKYFHKCEDDYQRYKKNRHIYRSLLYAVNMIEHKTLAFDAINANLKEHTIIDLDVLSKKIEETRKDFVFRYDNKLLSLAKNFNVDKGVELNRKMLELVKSETFIDSQLMLGEFDIRHEINAYENWVEYN